MSAHGRANEGAITLRKICAGRICKKIALRGVAGVWARSYIPGRDLAGVWGMSLFLLVHVALSLIGIVTGLVVLYGLLKSDRMDGMTLVFRRTTAATTLTGFFLPFKTITPAVSLSIISTIVLIPTFAAR